MIFCRGVPQVPRAYPNKCMTIYLDMFAAYLNKNYGEFFYETYSDKGGCSPTIFARWLKKSWPTIRFESHEQIDNDKGGYSPTLWWNGGKPHDPLSTLNHLSKIDNNRGSYSPTFFFFRHSTLVSAIYFLIVYYLLLVREWRCGHLH